MFCLDHTVLYTHHMMPHPALGLCKVPTSKKTLIRCHPSALDLPARRTVSAINVFLYKLWCLVTATASRLRKGQRSCLLIVPLTRVSAGGEAKEPVSTGFYRSCVGLLHFKQGLTVFEPGLRFMATLRFQFLEYWNYGHEPSHPDESSLNEWT